MSKYKKKQLPVPMQQIIFHTDTQKPEVILFDDMAFFSCCSVPNFIPFFGKTILFLSVATLMYAYLPNMHEIWNIL